MENENVLELGKLTINSFMGVDKSKPVIVDFTKLRKDQKVIELIGDQGTGKTSTVSGLLYALGSHFGLKKSQLASRKDKAIDIDLTFKKDGVEHKISADESRVELRQITNDKTKKLDEPVETIRNIFGPVTMSPFNVKEKKGRDQIKYFLETFGGGSESEKKINKLEDDINKVFTQRRDVNRDIKTLKSSLEVSPLFRDYEKSLKRFRLAPSETKELENYNAAKKNYELFTQATAKRASIVDKISSAKNLIASLEKQLAEAKAYLETEEGTLVKADEFIAQHKDATKNLQAAEASYQNVAKETAEYKQWKDLLKKEKDLIEMEEAAISATSMIDKMREQLLKLTKSCLPNVEGLEIRLSAGSIDKGEEGVYFNDQPIHELSTSEYEGLWVRILVEYGVNFLFIENLNNLGSLTIGVLNKLIQEEGVTVFGTRTKPDVKEMAIKFKTKVEN